MPESKKKRFFIDGDACIGCMNCVESHPDYFLYNEDEGKSETKVDDLGNAEEIIKSVNCPTDAIKYE